MRVLLTGANGFIGRDVLAILQHQGIDVVTLGRAPSKTFPQVEHISADLLTASNLLPLLKNVKATHLLHLAWYTEHGEFWDSKLNFLWVDATRRLVEDFCLAKGQRVVIAGTCAEYDWSYGYCREDNTPLNPSTLYGTAKDVTRRLVIAICNQYQTSCAWGRVFLTYGTGENKKRLIPSLIDAFQYKTEPFSVNAGIYRDFLHVSDVAKGFVTLLRADASGAYNISSAQPLQLKNLIIELAQSLNKDPDLILSRAVERKNEPLLVIGENTKLKNLGWKQHFTIDQGLKECL
jgi:nucleoside-diphosphate-sugar epimerase